VEQVNPSTSKSFKSYRIHAVLGCHSRHLTEEFLRRIRRSSVPLRLHAILGFVFACEMLHRPARYPLKMAHKSMAGARRCLESVPSLIHAA
jgi:hypothetical protein